MTNAEISLEKTVHELSTVHFGLVHRPAPGQIIATGKAQQGGQQQNNNCFFSITH